MNINRLIGPILGLAVILSLSACGGGSSDTSPGATTPPPTAITSVGSITGFGSVWINGVKYEIEAGTIFAIEGEAETMGDDSVLRLGMKVKVKGQADNGVRTAQSIEHDDDLKGPISNIVADSAGAATGTFDIISVMVTVDAGTVFDDDVGNNDGVPGIDFRDLQDGMVVEVSGFPTDTGFLATRVDRQLDALGGDPVVGDPSVDGDELEIKGFVEIVDVAGSTVTVNGITFDVGPGTVFEDGLMLNDDLLTVFVEVKADLVGGEWFAVRIEREDDFDEARDGDFEIEGILQSVDVDADPDTFTINGMTIAVTDASSLVALVGQRVEIKGSFNASDVLVLSQAQPDLDDNVRTEDLVTGIPDGTSFTTRLGLVITPTGASRVEDNSSDNGDHLTPLEFLGRLQAGDRIEARGHDNADGSVDWTRVQRDDMAINNSDVSCELRGPVTMIVGDETAFSFDIQGVTVSTNSVLDNDFEGANEAPIGRAAFFAALQDGDIVEATSLDIEGACVTAALDARQVEFEPAD